MSALQVDLALERGGFELETKFSAPLDGVTILFGPSGAGKSMLLAALAGLRPLRRGRIAFPDRVLNDADIAVPPHAREIGLVFQDARLFPHLSVRGNLAYAAKRAPEGGRDLAEVAAQFDIAALLDRAPRTLSGGEKSRVALARAILSRPRLLLLDEPFAALDGARRRAFLAILRETHAREHLPMIVVTHQIEDAAMLGDHMVALKAGRVAHEGAIGALAEAAPFQALLDAHDVGAALPAAAVRSAAAGNAAHIWVRADSVMLAARAPEGLSARNIWRGAVRALTRESDGAVLVSLDTAHGALLSRITADAAADLKLAPGAAAWAVFKAHAS